MSEYSEHEEIALYARVIGADIDQAQAIVDQQRRPAAIPRVEPHQLALITCDKTKRPSELARYAEVMNLTTSQALDKIREQREAAATNKNGCANTQPRKKKTTKGNN